MACGKDLAPLEESQGAEESLEVAQEEDAPEEAAPSKNERAGKVKCSLVISLNTEVA